MAFNWFGIGSNPETEIIEIYPLPIAALAFVGFDVQNIYTRILTDVLERTEGISDENQKLLWDNCVADGSQDGLITLVAKAMVDKADLFLVFDKAVNVIRKADAIEQQKIVADYKKQAESSTGMFITFKNYSRTDMIKFYSALEHCTVGALYKQMNLSKAVQLKITDLRSSVGLTDGAVAKAQAVKMAEGLRVGRDVLMDAKDVLETAKPDLTATNSAMEFIAAKQSFYLGLPASWITGLAKEGMSDSGKSDSKAVERGLKPYYFSIIKPVIETLFNKPTTFKSEDFEMLSTANETLKTFNVTDEQYISAENKLKITSKLYGLPENSEGDPPPPPAPIVIAAPGAPAATVPPPNDKAKGQP